jgi:putative FmdB family regulatory protein
VPIYEYRCSMCGERFEKLVRTSSGAAEVRCPKCDTEKVERQLSVFGINTGSAGGSFSSAPSCAPSSGG